MSLIKRRGTYRKTQIRLVETKIAMSEVKTHWMGLMTDKTLLKK